MGSKECLVITESVCRDYKEKDTSISEPVQVKISPTRLHSYRDPNLVRGFPFLILRTLFVWLESRKVPTLKLTCEETSYNRAHLSFTKSLPYLWLHLVQEAPQLVGLIIAWGIEIQLIVLNGSKIKTRIMICDKKNYLEPTSQCL